MLLLAKKNQCHSVFLYIQYLQDNIILFNFYLYTFFVHCSFSESGCIFLLSTNVPHQDLTPIFTGRVGLTTMHCFSYSSNYFIWLTGTIPRRDVGEASEPFRVSSRRLPNSITRIAIELFPDRYSGEVPPVGHPALAGGIIYEQSAMKQLQYYKGGTPP